jgi:hypothetical protein
MMEFSFWVMLSRAELVTAAFMPMVFWVRRAAI